MYVYGIRLCTDRTFHLPLQTMVNILTLMKWIHKEPAANWYECISVYSKVHQTIRSISYTALVLCVPEIPKRQLANSSSEMSCIFHRKIAIQRFRAGLFDFDFLFFCFALNNFHCFDSFKSNVFFSASFMTILDRSLVGFVRLAIVSFIVSKELTFTIFSMQVNKKRWKRKWNFNLEGEFQSMELEKSFKICCSTSSFGNFDSLFHTNSHSILNIECKSHSIHYSFCVHQCIQFHIRRFVRNCELCGMKNDGFTCQRTNNQSPTIVNNTE